MCFVVTAEEAGDDDSIYEPLVQKCAEYLVELEKVKNSKKKLGILRVYNPSF